MAIIFHNKMDKQISLVLLMDLEIDLLEEALVEDLLEVLEVVSVVALEGDWGVSEVLAKALVDLEEVWDRLEVSATTKVMKQTDTLMETLME